MKQRPFNAYPHEVRGILAGRQTQIRRVVKPQPTTNNPAVIEPAKDYGASAWIQRRWQTAGSWNGGNPIHCPFGAPGDQLWLRETFQALNFGYLVYNADLAMRRYEQWKFTGETDVWKQGEKPLSMKPSTQMPRWASRITLEIVNVRVERLGEISEADAIAEGVGDNGREDDRGRTFQDYRKKSEFCSFVSAKSSYWTLWESIHGPGSWAPERWVWVGDVKKVEGAK